MYYLNASTPHHRTRLRLVLLVHHEEYRNQDRNDRHDHTRAATLRSLQRLLLRGLLGSRNLSRVLLRCEWAV